MRSVRETALPIGKPLVGVVILNWNKPQKTIRCAESVLEDFRRSNAHADCRLVIVDNGSRDGSASIIESWMEKAGHSNIQLVTNLQNLGFAAGMNRGVHALAPASPDFHWLLNNDLTLEPGALQALLDAADSAPSVMIWGPTVISSLSGRIQCAGGCRYRSWLGLEVPLLADKSLQEALTTPAPSCDYIYGAAMFLRSGFIAETGGLDERYFLFFEELELSHKLSSSQSMAWCKNAIVYHDSSKAENTPKTERAFTAYHAALSAYRYTWRHYPFCIATVVLSRVLGLILYGVRDANAGLATAPLRALAHFGRHRS